MPLPNINKKVFDDIFRRCHETALVTLKKSKTKGTRYDKYRDTGWTETYMNAIPVKILKKTISGSSLSYQGLGVAQTGALAIIVSDDDVELIKNAEAITIDSNAYYAYSEAVGNKFLIYPTTYSSYSKIILFRRDT